MKNPRKSPGNPVGVLTKTMKGIQDELADLPFFLDPSSGAPSPKDHTSSPEEESFRAFLMKSLPRHKAAPALRERIKKAIKNMPD